MAPAPSIWTNQLCLCDIEVIPTTQINMKVYLYFI